MYRRVRRCYNNGGLESIPEPPNPHHHRAVKRTLETDGISVVDARVMLIASLDPEVTISRAGRLLFKTQDADAAERAFERLRGLLGLPDVEEDHPADSAGG
ncbi:MAG: hypothetical protein ACHQ0I_01305 [Candidatus Lutacidiplasmatales archaeon]